MLPREMLRLLEKVVHFPNKFSIRTQYMCSSTRHLYFLKKLSIYTLKLCISPQETVCLHLKNLYCPKIMLHSHDKLYIGWQKLCIYPSNTCFRVKCPDINEKHTRATGLLFATDSRVFLSVFGRRHCIMTNEKHYTNAFAQLICDSVLERSSFLEYFQ